MMWTSLQESTLETTPSCPKALKKTTLNESLTTTQSHPQDNTSSLEKKCRTSVVPEANPIASKVFEINIPKGFVG
jgi:hypothetical protein